MCSQRSVTSLAVVAIHDVSIAKQRVPEQHSNARIADSTTKRLLGREEFDGHQPTRSREDWPNLWSPAGFGIGGSRGRHWPDPGRPT